LYILSQLGKTYAYFLPFGEKFAFPPFFYPLSSICIFSPQPVIWPYFCPFKQKIYTPDVICMKYNIEHFVLINNERKKGSVVDPGQLGSVSFWSIRVATNRKIFSN